MPAKPDRRAMTPLYRVFGNRSDLGAADARVLAGDRDMHAGEHAAFAALVPVTIWAALAGWFGWLPAVPLAFLALTTLSLILPLGNRALQWMAWLGACLCWAVAHRSAGGFSGLVAMVWIGLGVMNSAAIAVLGWRWLMRIGGWWGIGARVGSIVAVHAAAVFVGWKFGWIWLGPAAVGIGAWFCAAVLRPGSGMLGEIVTTAEPPWILVTIDDGPDPRDTPVLLDLLDRYRTKAVFFLIGEKVAAHPDLAGEIVRRGHEVGNHTQTHPQATFWCAGPWRTWREIARCQAAIRVATGVTPRRFRAPVGHRNLFTHPVCRALGLDVTAWNRRGFDAVETNPQKVLARILADLGPGDIVLLHEATPIAAEVLEGVLKAIIPHRG